MRVLLYTTFHQTQAATIFKPTWQCYQLLEVGWHIHSHPGHWTSNRLEHHLSIIESTRTCSFFGNQTQTPYFWLQTNRHQTLCNPSLDLLNYLFIRLEHYFFQHRINLNVSFRNWTWTPYFWLQIDERHRTNIVHSNNWNAVHLALLNIFISFFYQVGNTECKFCKAWWMFSA